MLDSLMPITAYVFGGPRHGTQFTSAHPYFSCYLHLNEGIDRTLLPPQHAPLVEYRRCKFIHGDRVEYLWVLHSIGGEVAPFNENAAVEYLTKCLQCAAPTTNTMEVINMSRINEHSKRYQDACHAVQSGVAQEMLIDERRFATEPKHLRTGINIALRDQGSLVRLLIAKGVITEEEYVEAIADGMVEEQRDYEASLSKHYGTIITLA